MLKEKCICYEYFGVINDRLDLSHATSLDCRFRMHIELSNFPPGNTVSIKFRCQAAMTFRVIWTYLDIVQCSGEINVHNFLFMFNLKYRFAKLFIIAMFQYIIEWDNIIE